MGVVVVVVLVLRTFLLGSFSPVVRQLNPFRMLCFINIIDLQVVITSCGLVKVTYIW